MLIGVSSCKKDRDDRSDDEPKEAVLTTTVSGMVMDEQAHPVAGAEVLVGGTAVTTDVNGGFRMANVEVPAKRCVVRVLKNGYFESVVGMQPFAAGTRAQVTLMSKGSPTTLAAATGGVVSTAGGAQVELPANGFQTQAGAAYTGSVQAYVRYVRPDDAQITQLMPGGDFLAVDNAGADRILTTYGVVRVELEGNGQALQLQPGKTAQLRFPAVRPGGPAVVPLWHFDEEVRLWKPEGSASLAGGTYTGRVSHFSAWNLDTDAPCILVQGTIKDCAGNPVPGYRLFVGETQVITNDEGRFSGLAPADVQVAVRSSFATLNTGFSRLVPPTPTGAIYNLGTLVPCLPAVAGRLLDCNNQPAKGSGRVVSPAGEVLYSFTTNDGRFRVYGPAGTSAQLQFFPENGTPVSQSLAFPANGQNGPTTDVRLCNVSPLGRVIMGFTINGDGYTNQRVELRDATFPSATLINKPGNGGQRISDLDLGASTGPVPHHTAELAFPGVGVGTYTARDTGSGIIMNFGSSTANTGYYYSYSPNSLLTVQVTRYDPVGGRVQGTFSGTLLKRQGCPGCALTTTTVTITNGTFDVPRGADW
ncbi:carboxypeptidase-like regulatory domain-containing protein [Hymenobacter sp. B81]|uniref:carboxypeptidase-like regulatory domain-containing protein n=1 Tax=Hymenobacter sp. B81 TaxID=3344878 RepID=UPI0037DC0D4D